MNKKEFDEKYKNISTDLMTDEQFWQFKQDCFEMYETTGFSDFFHSPYDDPGYDHNGKPFEVVRRAKEGECDIEAMPLWVVKFEDEEEPYFCYPEEICKIEE